MTHFHVHLTSEHQLDELEEALIDYLDPSLN